MDDARAVDGAITAALEAVDDEGWARLWSAVEDAAALDEYATWETPDGQMPYPVYAEPVDRVRQELGALGLVVPFAWPDWDGTARYTADPAALEQAPVTDAVRLLVAILRSERFTDGSIEGALQSGVMQAALARLRRWHDTGT
ncbi:MAG TPA: DUF6508 domain-containing protein [Acidimicrobiales bacterium]